jgi:hypothetical protein
MKKLLVVLSILGILSLTACGNMEVWDGMTNKSNTWTYAEVRMPDGTIKEGRIAKWADYESDALKLIFEDGTELITSYNCAVISKGKVQR